MTNVFGSVNSLETNSNDQYYLHHDLVTQQRQNPVAALLAIRQLQILDDLQWFLAGRQPDAVLRREETDAPQTLALPPVRVAGVDDGDLVTSVNSELIEDNWTKA